jgi:hypothetical protein
MAIHDKYNVESKNRDYQKVSRNHLTLYFYFKIFNSIVFSFL